MKIGNLPAFPSHGSMGEVVQEGMTLRQHYAGLALQGFIASEAFDFDIGSNYERLAIRAVKAADALLAELEKSE